MPPIVDRIVQLATCWDAEDRYGSADEMLDHVTEALIAVDPYVGARQMATQMHHYFDVRGERDGLRARLGATVLQLMASGHWRAGQGNSRPLGFSERTLELAIGAPLRSAERDSRPVAGGTFLEPAQPLRAATDSRTPFGGHLADLNELRTFEHDDAEAPWCAKQPFSNGDRERVADDSEETTSERRLPGAAREGSHVFGGDIRDHDTIAERPSLNTPR